MKKITVFLVCGLLPCGAFAVRSDPNTCDSYDNIPYGYCCINYHEGNGYADHLWKCDNLNLNSASMAACKSERSTCIDYCYEYDLDNDTCNDYQHSQDYCESKWVVVANPMDATDCTIPNAETCEYKTVCDQCGNNCHREDEEVTTCIDRHYNTEDWSQCLPCPGNGVVDYDVDNLGIASCYIPRGTMTGSDSTGTFKYQNDKCYYKS